MADPDGIPDSGASGEPLRRRIPAGEVQSVASYRSVNAVMVALTVVESSGTVLR